MGRARLACAALAVWLASALLPAGPSAAGSDLDCAQRAEARLFIGRLRLAEIEGAEDIHRAAMWEAFGRCPAGSAGESCRTAERSRFEAAWEGQRRQIDAKYRRMLAEFEQRCLGAISRLGR